MMVLKASGAPVRAWKIDAEAFYRKIGRRPDQVWRQAMVTPAGNWQIDWRCQFGDASVAVKAIQHSNHMASVAKQRLRQFDASHPPSDSRVIAWQRERYRTRPPWLMTRTRAKYVASDGSEPPPLAMALRALVRQTTKAKPKAALQW